MIGVPVLSRLGIKHCITTRRHLSSVTTTMYPVLDLQMAYAFPLSVLFVLRNPAITPRASLRVFEPHQLRARYKGGCDFSVLTVLLFKHLQHLKHLITFTILHPVTPSCGHPHLPLNNLHCQYKQCSLLLQHQQPKEILSSPSFHSTTSKNVSRYYRHTWPSRIKGNSYRAMGLCYSEDWRTS